MTVYLDNNVLVSIENGEVSLDGIKSLLQASKVRFFYSSAHIYEVEHFKTNTSITKDALLTKRFNTIRNITKNNYLFMESNKITHIMEDPQEVYETITQVPFGIEAIKGFMGMISREQKEEIREKMGIEIHKLNNYIPSEVIDHLNTKLPNLGENMSFLELIEEGIKGYPGGEKFGIHHRIVSIFELLEMFGYWKDKETQNSNYARLWDAKHTSFASFCDVFISDDKRIRYKAHVVYNLYHKPTKIMSSSGISE